jgi:hypothetical protein
MQSLLDFATEPRIMSRGLVSPPLPRSCVGPPPCEEVCLGWRPGRSIDSDFMGADSMKDCNGFPGIAEGAQFTAVGGGQRDALAAPRLCGDKEFAPCGLDGDGPKSAGAKSSSELVEIENRCHAQTSVYLILYSKYLLK